MDSETDCKCIKIVGHLEAVKWLLYPRQYRAAPGALALADWTTDPYLWMHYVESADGLLPEDDVLKSGDARYTSIADVQRYLVARLHCETVLFTSQYPSLRLPTTLGTYFWRANTALKLPNKLYLKEFHTSLDATLKKMEHDEVQMDRLIVSDLMIKIERLDHFKRQTFFRILLNIISVQKRLQMVSFEGLCCRRLEGARLLQQLACFCARSLKYLFLWRFVLPNENPLLVNYSYITGSGQYIPRPSTRHCFLRSLAQLTGLRLLALEYSQLADGSGAALLTLLPVLKRPHFRLQFICREDQVPGRADAALGVGGHGIPDTAWRKVAVACPDLYILMVFFRVRDYDNVRRFLSPSIPLRELQLQLGVDLLRRQRQDSDVGCLLRHAAHFFGNTLVSLSIHQWRGATFPLRRVLELLPRLARLRYAGRVRAEPDLRRALNVVATGVCDKLKHLEILVQDEESRRSYWQKSVEKLSEEFEEIMKLYEIVLCLGVYKN